MKKVRISAEKQRELQVAAAVAREAILQAHVARALKLIELAGDRVSAVRMLEIYARVQELHAAEAEAVAMRLLASIGQKAKKGIRPAVYVEGEKDDDGRSIVSFVRDRLRGRVHHDLRRWVELHAGVTRVALLDIYVKHAVKFAEDLRETHPTSAALSIFRDLTGVPNSMKEALEMFVLEKLAANELPRGGGVRLSTLTPQEPQSIMRHAASSPVAGSPVGADRNPRVIHSAGSNL